MRVLVPLQALHSIRTRRSLLPPPQDRSDPRWAESWSHLFHTYAPAMERYVRRLLVAALGPAAAEDAADVVQEFLAACLERGWLAREAAGIRCFRAYLQTALRRFALKHVERRRAAKRDPGAACAPAELAAVAGPGADPADADLDAGVLDVALGQALARLREGNAEYGEVIADLLRTSGSGSDDLPALLGRRPADLPVLRHRARRRFAALLADELRATVRDDDAYGALLARLEPLLP